MAIINIITPIVGALFFWAWFKFMMVPEQKAKAQRRRRARK
jgi:hypothetical protein